jgi:cobalt-zinc-cadmium efflux system outer membrane protein
MIGAAIALSFAAAAPAQDVGRSSGLAPGANQPVFARAGEARQSASRGGGEVRATPVGAPLTFQAAFDLAASRNLGLEAARRQKAIRDAQIRIAKQYLNPDVAFEASRDVPHEVLTFNIPVEIGGKRGRRIELAQTEAAQADLDVRTEMRTLRRNLRQSFYGLLAADERVRLAEEIVALVERLRQVTQARFEEGAAPRLDVLAADLGVARATADLDLARSARTAAQADLNAVFNQPAGQALTVRAEGYTPHRARGLQAEERRSGLAL